MSNIEEFPVMAIRLGYDEMTEREAIDELLECCEKIKPHWQKHLEFWEEEDPGSYNEIAVFVHYIVEQYEKGRTNDFSAVFGVIEKMILQGTEPTRGLATVGFIETLRNVSSHKDFGITPFLRWMGPKSVEALAEIEQLWRGKSTLADVIRSTKEKDG